MADLEHERGATDVRPVAADAGAFPREMTLVATVAWLVLIAANLVSTPSTDARIAAMDEPALTAARSIERMAEVAALELARSSDTSDWLQGSDNGITGDGPLGLDRDYLESLATTLIAATGEVLAAADAAHAAEDDETAERLAREGAVLGARAIVVAAAAGLERPPIDPRDFAAPGPLVNAIALADELGASDAAPIEDAAGDGEAAADDGSPIDGEATADIEAPVDADAPSDAGSTVDTGSSGETESSGEAVSPSDTEPPSETESSTDTSVPSNTSEQIDGAPTVDDAAPLGTFVTAPSATPIDPRLAGLPELLVLDARGDLPPTREWAVARALDGLAPLMGIGSLLTFFGLVAFVVLIVARRRFPPESPALSSRLHLLDGWTAFVLGQIGFILLSTLLGAAGAGGITGFTVLATSVPIAVFALVAAGWRRDRPGSLGPAVLRLGLGTETGTVLKGLAFGIGAAPFLMVGLLLIQLTGAVETSIWGSPYTDFVVAGGIDAWRKLALEAGLAAPIFEEFAFRGVLFAALRSRMGFASAALVSSSTFAVMHPYDLGGLLIILWVGFALAWLYERTGSLLACMVAHALYNLAQLSITLVLL